MVIIAPKEMWDDDGNIDDDFSSKSFSEEFPYFLSTEMFAKGTFPLDEDYSEQEVRDKMEKMGFEYDLELQASFSEIEEDVEEDYENDNDGFWNDMHNPSWTLN